MTPVALIARALQRERNKAGMSLSALAEQAGLAKSTLSQLESGQGNPSVETLWALASALNIPFSFLFETPQAETTLIRADEGAQIASDSAEFCATLLANCPPASRRDLYRLNMHAGPVRRAKPHPQGTVEHALVISGTVRVGPDQDSQELKAGDYYRYPADVAHLYESLSDHAVVILVMESPR